MDFALIGPRLAITTAGYIVSFLSSVGIALFVLWRSERKITHVMFFFFNMAVAVFAAMFVSATVIRDPSASANIWLLSANDIFIAVFYLHWVLALIGKLREKRVWLVDFYVLGGALLAAIAFYPKFLIAGAEPKMYFNNYPVPGFLYGILILYFVAVVLFAFWQLVAAYRSANEEMRNRLRYILAGSIVGYSTGASSFLLSYNIPVDPVFSALFGVYSFLYAYAILKYRLMNIRIAVRRAAFSAVVIGALSWLMFMVSLANGWLAENIPGIPQGAVPILAGVFAFGLGFYFWRIATESDRVKQEFLTVAAHKLRAPLTRIKFSANALEEKAEEKTKLLARRITEDTDHMIDLANVLLEAAEIESDAGRVASAQPFDLAALVSGMLDSSGETARQKHITLARRLSATPALALGDENRARMVLHLLIENALAYTPEHGTITVALEPAENEWVVSVHDTGIGILPEDMPHIFSKFFRSKEALSRNTEGLGLSLFLAKNMMREQGGRLWADSRGENAGSAFSFSLPAAKKAS